MPATRRWRKLVEGFLSIGAHPGEAETRRSGRRVFLIALAIATVLSIPLAVSELMAGYTWVGVTDVVTLVVPVILLAAIARWPTRYVACLHAMFGVIVLALLLDTAMFGGLLPSGLLVIFVLDCSLAALLAIGTRAGLMWFAVFLLSVVYAVTVPGWVDPLYTIEDPTGQMAFNLIGTGIVTVAVLVYFVRQRDQYQKRSDDLLHAILPEEIAAQLKDRNASIAEDVESASVLFADVVDFTPMSAAMSPAQLVELLDDVFTAFDGFVAELDLEKIKTVGDAYMAAAGVPRPRDDHAIAIGRLALRIRDHVATSPIDGRRLSFRIGINSGPVTAGVIGTRKFSYDLWGDTVNIASRMESSGIPGTIQVSPSTYELIKDDFVCEPRGTIPVKGKDAMRTYLLVAERPDAGGPALSGEGGRGVDRSAAGRPSGTPGST